jgi:hypothetical protein
MQTVFGAKLNAKDKTIYWFRTDLSINSFLNTGHRFRLMEIHLSFTGAEVVITHYLLASSVF